ncbi:hypothetical protein C8F04DRAFT_1128787 [Mycena alexandri]|uniref:F-box domain-containing protein n=1 Tax=Mycena alexandri TaxID=1745969 RepID=A0AAD6SH62_9AGAR|nr:hypothetical protein C8F04DRAFT_1128787 [Mycena alexandri]
MSVDELQARIDAISADIDRQKNILKQLERSKSALQRQLNNIRDPVARLPLELSSEIFLHCLPRAPSLTPQVHTVAPLLLLQICNGWTDIALSTPTLWATIRMGLEAPGVELLEVWLQRAHNCGLSISLLSTLQDRLRAATILHKSTEYLKHLEIYEEEGHALLPSSMTIFPCLETLIICGARNPYGCTYFGLATVVELLSLTPNLVECTLHHFYHTWDELQPPPHLTLPNLTCLKFGRTTNIYDLGSWDYILRYMTLPALQTLFFPFSDIPAGDFFLFLDRSSPPLRKLVIGAECGHFSFAELSGWIHTVPSLVHLEMRVPVDIMNDLFTAIAENPSDFLPHLQNLQIYHDIDSWGFDQAAYEVLLQTLLIRRGTLLLSTTKISPA